MEAKVSAERASKFSEPISMRVKQGAGMLAVFSLAVGGTPAFAKSGEAWKAAPSVSPIKADAERGTLKVDERASQHASAPTAITEVVPEPSPERSDKTVAMVAWVPSGMPTEGVALSSRYGWRIHPIHGDARMHRGIDIPGGAGSPVFATAEGTVTLADWSGGYGLLVEIDHGAGLDTRYAHLSSLAVTEGQRVRKGHVLGFVGSTGNSTGPHLHYEVRMAGEAVDPLAFLFSDVSLTTATPSPTLTVAPPAEDGGTSGT
jgi:murein DD-endopeptidase MepM/ murein hydrolase activator NlpD